MIANDPGTGKRLGYPYYFWILRDGDVAVTLALQGEQRGDPTALTLMFQYHCWGKQQQRETEEPGWKQRYIAGRGAYKDGLYLHMDQLKRRGWQPSQSSYTIAKKALAVTEPCSKVIDDANSAVAELLRVVEELGDPRIP
jgi:hypothetical protein